MQREILLLGVDGGGTCCRARLTDAGGLVLGEGLSGPANVRLGAAKSMAAVLEAAGQCYAAAGLSNAQSRTVACLALAGASEPAELKLIRGLPHPFRHVSFTSDAHAACAGAHLGGNGGIIIIGTGAAGYGMIDGAHHRIGGWGFPISDEGSGAWLGLELVRRVLWAEDGRMEWTPLLSRTFERFQSDAHLIVRWMDASRPKDFATLAPLIVDHAVQGDAAARDLMVAAASHIDALAACLVALSIDRIALCGGLSGPLVPWLAEETKRVLVEPAQDALGGALLLARANADAHPIAA